MPAGCRNCQSRGGADGQKGCVNHPDSKAWPNALKQQIFDMATGWRNWPLLRGGFDRQKGLLALILRGSTACSRGVRSHSTTIQYSVVGLFCPRTEEQISVPIAV